MFQKIVKAINALFKPKYQTISVSQVKSIVEKGTVLILDVRSKGEFSQGKIKGAKNIPLGELDQRISEIEKYRNKPILVHCFSGGRSASACSYLHSKGFTDLTNLAGGIMAWQSSGMKLS